MSQLSVIIPVVRTLSRLEDTLVSVLEYRPEDCDVVVVLDEPYADPYRLEGEVTFIRAQGGLPLAQAINLGFRASTGQWVHVLPCGNLVVRGWAEAAQKHFAESRLGVIVPVTLSCTEPSKILAAGMGYDRAGRLVHLQRGVSAEGTVLSHRTRVLPHFSGALFRRDSLQAVNGADESLGDGWVLADLTLRLFQCGYSSVLEPECRVRSDPALEPPNYDYLAARDAERFFWRWRDRRGSTLVRHLALLTSQALAALPRGQLWPHVAGRLAGWRKAGGLAHAPLNGHSTSTILSGKTQRPTGESSYVAKAG